MTTIRVSKAVLAAACGAFVALVVFNNVTDYGSNLLFVQHVLSMDTTFPGNAGMWRAIRAPLVHHVFYAGIIAWEIMCTGLLLIGAYRLYGQRAASAAAFERAKPLAIAGLTAGLLLWLVAFMSVGGEWFLMWQSEVWNGNDTAGRLFTVQGIVLLYVSMPEPAQA